MILVFGYCRNVALGGHCSDNVTDDRALYKKWTSELTGSHIPKAFASSSSLIPMLPSFLLLCLVLRLPCSHA